MLSGYQLSWKTIETRDENLTPSALDVATETPVAFIRFGNAAQQARGFIDTPSLGKVREMTPIDVRIVLYDSGIPGTDTITLQMAKALEDVREAIGDNLKLNIASVYDVQIGPYFRPQSTWFMATEEIIMPIMVWHEFDQRDPVPAQATGFQAPYDFSNSVAEGQATFSWTNDAAVDHVNIWKNGVEVETNYTETTWYDPSWQFGDLYRFEADDGAGVLASTPIFQFPYYPTSRPEFNYYRLTWVVGTQTVAQMSPGDAPPEMLIENRIRQEIELRMMDNGVLSDDVAYTSAGPLLDTNLISTRMPLVHVEAVNSSVAFAGSQDTDVGMIVNLSVLDDADQAAADRIDSRVSINRVLNHLRVMCMSDGAQKAQAWDGVGGAYGTIIESIDWASDAVLIGTRRLFRGQLQATVNFHQPWRGN